MLMASRIMVHISTILAIVVVIEYAVFSPAWKKSVTGKFLMSIFILFAFTLTTASLTILVGLTPWIVWLRFLTYIALVVAFLMIAILIVSIQEAAYQTEKDRLAEVARLTAATAVAATTASIHADAAADIAATAVREDKENGQVDHES